jgi:hypothetical protein
MNVTTELGAIFSGISALERRVANLESLLPAEVSARPLLQDLEAAKESFGTLVLQLAPVKSERGLLNFWRKRAS